MGRSLPTATKRPDTAEPRPTPPSIHPLGHELGISRPNVALRWVGRYGYARQMRRMRRTTSKLKTVLGRVYRDMERKLAERPNTVQAVFADEMALAKRLLAQKRQDPNKLYALHAPEVECIAKGKVPKRYEFGVKVSIATTNRSNLVVGAQARPGHPYDGHMLKDALSQVQRVTGTRPQRCYVDLGYRGHDVNDVAVFKARQKRGVTAASDES